MTDLEKNEYSDNISFTTSTWEKVTLTDTLENNYEFSEEITRIIEMLKNDYRNLNL